MRKDKLNKSEFQKFDQTMEKLLAVPYSELKKKLDEEKVIKKKKSVKTSSFDRVSRKKI